MIYIICFAFIFFPYMINQKNVNNQYNSKGKNNQHIYGKYYVFISILLILLLTLRHDYVGTDTQNYRWFYNTIYNNRNIYNAISEQVDFGFLIFNKILLYFNLDFRWSLFIHATFYIGAVSFIIKRYSKNPALSYFLFMTMGYFIFATTMRQAMATAFTLLAFNQIKKKKMIAFIIFVLLASTFHFSALIFIPAYWFDKFRPNKITLGLIIFLTIGIFVLRNEIGYFILGFNKNEYLISKTGGYLLILFYLALMILGILYKKSFLLYNNNNKLLFYMLCATLAIIPVSKLNPALFRLTNYYAIFIIIYIPNLLYSIKDKNTKFILFFFIFFVGLYYFYFKLNSYGIRMHPYVFFWEQYPSDLIPPGLLPSG